LLTSSLSQECVLPVTETVGQTGEFDLI
jgi:hypothetical protein